MPKSKNSDHKINRYRVHTNADLIFENYCYNQVDVYYTILHLQNKNIIKFTALKFTETVLQLELT